MVMDFAVRGKAPGSSTRPANYARAGDLVCTDQDMLLLASGELAAVIGMWGTWPVRARLCYIPDPDGATRFGTERYRKVTYERSGALRGTTQVLALPGENHYLVPETAVAGHFPTVPAGPESSPAARAHAAVFDRAGCEARLAGSRLLGCPRPGSDYDWVIWCDTAAQVRSVVEAEPRAHASLHFGFEHVMRKYGHFGHFDTQRLQRLFADRWRHVEWPREGLQMSYLPAARTWLADAWREVTRTGIPGTVTGTVAGDDASYFAPTLLRVETDGRTVQVGTWLFLYRGTFAPGDQVTVIGEWATGPFGDVILVEGSSDAIIKH